MFPADRRAEALAGATHILLTHSHGDHAADAATIAAETGAPMACIHELAEWLGGKGTQTIGFGERHHRLRRCQGDHGQRHPLRQHRLWRRPPAAGRVGGGFHGRRRRHVIYISGDTDIMADMGWMAEYHKPDIGILSCGGHYTMDMDRAAFAARKYFQFRTVIPCHYRTFPLLAQNADALRAGLPPGIEVIRAPGAGPHHPLTTPVPAPSTPYPALAKTGDDDGKNRSDGRRCGGVLLRCLAGAGGRAGHPYQPPALVQAVAQHGLLLEKAGRTVSVRSSPPTALLASPGPRS